MSIQESAIAYHDQGYNCAQSVLAALQGETGLDENTAKRVAAGFGGGGRWGGGCGPTQFPHASIVMAFGLAADQATATAMTKQMTQSFRAEFGCLRCQELVAKNGGKGHCAHMIAWGAQRAEEILAENKVKE